MSKLIFERRHQGKHNFFRSQELQKVAENRRKTDTKNSTLKSIEKCSKMTSFGSPWGGQRNHFFDGFWHLGPRWCPRCLQGGSRGAQRHPKYQLLLIVDRFWVDFEVILATFGCSRECPSHKMNVKIWAAFPYAWRLQGYQKSGSIPPVTQPPKWISKFGQHSVLLFKSAREQIAIWFCQSTMPKTKRWPLS